MPVIKGDNRPDGKIRVWQMNKEINERPGWTSVDHIPEFPPTKRGINYVMLYDPKAVEFEFEEEKRALTQEEATESVAEALNRIADALEKTEHENAEEKQRST